MYLAFRDVNFDELLIQLKQANYFYAILASLIGVLLGGLIRSYRWKFFLEPIKKEVKFRNLFSSMMIGYMMNSIVPKSGEVSRPVVFAKQEDISRAAAFGTIIVERIFDMLSLFVSFGFCLFYFRESIFDAFGNDFEQYALYGSIVVLVGVMIMVVMILNFEKTELFIEKYITRFLPEKIRNKVKDILVSLINGFSFVKYPKNYLIIFILSVLLWLSYALSTYVLFFAFDINLNFLDANLLLTIITFTLVLPLPGNSAGAFHVVCTTVLVSIYAINKEVALSYATVSHLLNFVFLVAIGFYYSIKENIQINLKDEKVQTN
jgi:glycosyltransferase 2 family protein